MPRPKSAGKDPRFGRLSSRILDELLDDERRRKRFLRRIENLSTRAYKKAMRENACAPVGPVGAPEPVALMQVATMIAQAEEVISKIREREQKLDAAVMAMLGALNASEDDAKPEPMRFVVEVSSPERPKSEPDEE